MNLYIDRSASAIGTIMIVADGERFCASHLWLADVLLACLYTGLHKEV